MVFRPQIVLTAVSVATFGFLIWLGVWQLQRAEWKAGLIAEFDQLTLQDSVDWKAGVCDQLDSKSPGAETPPIDASVIASRIPPDLSEANSLRVFGRSPAGQVGWRILSPVPLTGCASPTVAILVEHSFTPEQVGPLPPLGTADGIRYHATAWPDRPAMAAANDPEANEWYWFDADRMATTLGQPELLRTLVIVPFAGMPDYLTRTPPVRHISYAVTWFGLAICLVIVYLVLHVRAGRLSLRS